MPKVTKLGPDRMTANKLTLKHRSLVFPVELEWRDNSVISHDTKQRPVSDREDVFKHSTEERILKQLFSERWAR